MAEEEMDIEFDEKKDLQTKKRTHSEIYTKFEQVDIRDPKCLKTAPDPNCIITRDIVSVEKANERQDVELVEDKDQLSERQKYSTIIELFDSQEPKFLNSKDPCCSIQRDFISCAMPNEIQDVEFVEDHLSKTQQFSKFNNANYPVLYVPKIESIKQPEVPKGLSVVMINHGVGKLKVGARHFVPCKPQMTVAELQIAIANITQIHPNQQKLYKDQIELDYNMRLADYGYSCKENENVFCLKKC